MASKILFHHTSTVSDHTYELLDLRITCESDDYGQRNPKRERQIVLHWQRTIDKPDHGYYGFSIALEASDSEDLEHCFALVRKLGKDLDFSQYTQPAVILAKLISLHAIECVYDARENELVPLDRVQPLDFKPWRDDDSQTGYDGCTVGCLAPNETIAKQRIFDEFVRMTKRGIYDSDGSRFAAWLQAGRPVRRLDSYWDRAPDVTSFAKRIKVDQVTDLAQAA